MWKWFLGFILILILLKSLSSCSAFNAPVRDDESHQLAVVPADQLPKLQQNGVGYKPKYLAPVKELKHAELENGFEAVDEEVMLNDHATD